MSPFYTKADTNGTNQELGPFLPPSPEGLTLIED